MNRATTFIASWLVATSLAGLAHAGSVTLHPELTEPDEAGFIVPAINASYREHTVAASRWLLDVTQQGNDLTAREFDQFARPFLTGTFLGARYTWINPRTAEQNSRIYFAASVREDPWLPPRYSPVRPYADYFAVVGGTVRATLGAAEGSRVTHIDVGDRNPDARQGDAEIRLLRTLEREMRSRGVGPRGRLSIFVSTKVCDSCEIALQRFANDEDIDIDVFPLARDPESAIRKAFKRRRKDMMDSLQCDLSLRKTRGSGSTTTPHPHGSPPPLSEACAGLSIH